MIVVYGLKNCDSCREALSLLKAGDAAHRFHDLRADGLPTGRLAHWLGRVGWEVLLNRRSTTWRQLPEAEKVGVDAAAAARLLERHPTLIKRPVIEAGGTLLVGFAPPQREALKALAGA
ncbi:MAG TPA: ArsC/Spx/MgsR family protein [Kiloniellaceae bacterium]